MTSTSSKAQEPQDKKTANSNGKEKVADSGGPKGSKPQAIDPVVLGHALTRALERSAPLLRDYFERHNMQGGAMASHRSWLDMQEKFATYMSALASDPRKLAELHLDYWKNWARIWQHSIQKIHGQKVEDIYKPDPTDRRFRSAEWNENLLFNFIKQSYLMTSDWLNRAAVAGNDGMDKTTAKQIEFYTKQFADAIAPTNFLMTNPDVLRETVKTGGENLVRGLENLITDMERGGGEVKISTTNYSAFEPGKNLATTKGSVVFQNDMMQLIQYEPTTEKVLKTPVLVVPPWINKYYILDMRPENSFIKWMVDQGNTVFVISWVNPDSKLAHKAFSDYMKEGVLEALKQVQSITKESKANMIGYCIGGTLLTITLAWLKAKGLADQVQSATFLTTLIDFEEAGELKIFTDEKQISAMEKEMETKGVLSGDSLAKTFSILRSNDMIWSFVINNYLLGKEPFPFDLLYWNSDSTNMPAAMHSYYLRNMYLENRLIKSGALEIEGVSIDVEKIDVPAYFLSTREDHIAPWKATFSGYTAFSGEKKFTLSASGHIAGVVNPPAAKKYCYWSNPAKTDNPDEWFEKSKQTDGSWWPDWQDWIESHSKTKIPAREIGKSLEPAPGSYVKKTLGKK